MISSVLGASRFRYEADMIPSLKRAIPELAFGHRYRDDVDVFTEVPAEFGKPDVVAVRFDRRAITVRDRLGVQPLLGYSEVRVVHAIGSAGAEIGEISAEIGLSRDHLRRAVVPLLSDLGWIYREGDRYLRRREVEWAVRRVVTVEAKLGDWRRALYQARRQLTSSDATYIALDASSTNRVRPYLSELSAAGVGVLTVSAATSVVATLSRPTRSGKVAGAVGRSLLGERTLAMLAEGRHEGAIGPVFGWSSSD